MSKAWQRGFVLVLAAASLAAIGCSSGGDGGGVRMLEADIADLEMLRDELAVAKEAVEKQAAAEKVARETAETELAAEKVARQTAETNAAVQTALVTERTARLNEAQAAKLKAEEDLTAARRALEQSRADATADVAAAAEQVVLLRAQVRTLTEEVATLKEELKTAQAEIDAVTETPTDPTHPGLTAGDDTDTATTTPTTPTTPTSSSRERDVEASARALGLMRALQREMRSATSDTVPTSNQISDVAALSPEFVNTNSAIRVTAFEIGKVSTSPASPSLRLGSTNLLGTRLSRSDPGVPAEEVVVYTDFQRRRVKLLDYDEFTGQVGGGIEGTRDNRFLNLNSSILAMRFLEELITQPSSSIALTADAAKNVLTAPMISDVTDRTISIGGEDVQVQRRPQPRAGVALSHVTAGERIVYETTKDRMEMKIDPTVDASIRVSFNGSVRGVPGTFSCDGGSQCQFTVSTFETASGRYNPRAYGLDGNGTWTFKPGSATTTIPADDKEYLWFGWWQTTPGLADGGYTFRLLAGGQGSWANDDTLKSGTARYEGPAIGKYAKGKPLEVVEFADLSDRAYEAGTFTATAILDAEFSTSDVTSLTGTISGFQGAGTGNWLVELTGDIFNVDDVSSGMALLKINGKVPVESLTAENWDVRFLGDHNTAAYNGAGGGSHPRSAVGRFDVGLEDDLLHISGVFGAIRSGQ